MGEKRIIKKYPNRRLYDTAISGYITVADVKQMIIECENIEVVDAKTGQDLTRQVLLQILLEEEASGSPLLNNNMLCQMIRMYGQASQSILGQFLEQNMKIFTDWQHNAQKQVQSIGDTSPWLKSFTETLPVANQSLSLTEWQQSLQQQTLRFWQDMGIIQKKND